MATAADRSTLQDQITAAEEEFLELWVRGPIRTTWASLPPQAGDTAPDLELLDSTGRPVLLSRFWHDRPALLLFWRHYGCGCGRDRAVRLRDEYGGYLDAGAEVVVVGQAEPERSTAYAEQHGIGCTVLCDPEYGAYEAYGLVEALPAQILFDAPEAFLGHSRELGAEFQRERRGQGRPLVDNPWLLPGEFVVDTSGLIRLAYRYQYCEDFPNPLVLTTAIREARDGADRRAVATRPAVE
jgi:peroxiredoxin